MLLNEAFDFEDLLCLKKYRLDLDFPRLIFILAPSSRTSLP